jgi:hypothetical protein
VGDFSYTDTDNPTSIYAKICAYCITAIGISQTSDKFIAFSTKYTKVIAAKLQCTKYVERVTNNFIMSM